MYDGWLNFASTTNKKARLSFKQSLDKFNYFWYVFNILSHYCSSYPILNSSVRNNKRNVALLLQTRSLPCFTKLHLLFYNKNIKIIPNDIFNLLDPIALAHWICGDGQFLSKGIQLCTDSYSIQDTVKLIYVLIIRYNLICTLHNIKGNYRIYISRKSVGKVVELVKPYIIPSMYYKLGIKDLK